MGAGNIFRILVAGAQQDLLDVGLTDTGIIAYEGFDEEIVPQSFTPFDNLTLAVTLNADSTVDKQVIASIADAFTCDLKRVKEIISSPTLQMISFTITENGYAINPEKVCNSPSVALTTMEQTAAGLLARMEQHLNPIALVSMDNFAENGEKVKHALLTIAQVWYQNGTAPAEFIEYINAMSYPWTMIDKITPRPSEDVAKILAADGFEDTLVTKTTKNTFVASFVNAESAEYLIIEDNFPNGRPPLEKAGVYMTDKDTVRKMDQMKVCACLNPLHTILAVVGPLLNYPTISACMQDKRLVKLLEQSAKEAMPTVAHPDIIAPEDFLKEVLIERFPNPFIPDTPARIATDTSQKVPVRFGVAMKERREQNIPIDTLEAAPLFIAMWLRYRMGLDDKGNKFDISPDPLLPEEFKALTGLSFGTEIDLRPMLALGKTFGINLNETPLGKKIESLFYDLSSGVWAVTNKLDELYS